jgi:hypothetical protein
LPVDGVPCPLPGRRLNPPIGPCVPELRDVAQPNWRLPPLSCQRAKARRRGSLKRHHFVPDASLELNEPVNHCQRLLEIGDSRIPLVLQLLHHLIKGIALSEYQKQKEVVPPAESTRKARNETMPPQ